MPSYQIRMYFYSLHVECNMLIEEKAPGFDGDAFKSSLAKVSPLIFNEFSAQDTEEEAKAKVELVVLAKALADAKREVTTEIQFRLDAVKKNIKPKVIDEEKNCIDDQFRLDLINQLKKPIRVYRDAVLKAKADPEKARVDWMSRISASSEALVESEKVKKESKVDASGEGAFMAKPKKTCPDHKVEAQLGVFNEQLMRVMKLRDDLKFEKMERMHYRDDDNLAQAARIRAEAKQAAERLEQEWEAACVVAERMTRELPSDIRKSLDQYIPDLYMKGYVDLSLNYKPFRLHDDARRNLAVFHFHLTEIITLQSARPVDTDLVEQQYRLATISSATLPVSVLRELECYIPVRLVKGYQSLSRNHDQFNRQKDMIIRHSHHTQRFFDAIVREPSKAFTVKLGCM